MGSVDVERITVSLCGGSVVDLSSGAARTTDVVIRSGVVESFADDGAGTGDSVVDGLRIDCAGSYVLPGLIDLHCHIYDGVFDVAVPADDGQLRRGVVVANDAGSAGASGVRGFRRHVVEQNQCRVFQFLNLSTLGVVNIHVGELTAPGAVSTRAAIDAIRANPDVIRGVKVRLSENEAGSRPLEYLDQAIEVGDEAGVPVMVHVGATACTLTEILDRLRPGDLVTHVFHGKAQGLLEDGAVVPAAWAAKDRGVLFDVGHGTTQMSYRIAAAAIREGFIPDTISTDLSRRNWFGPAYDLPTVMSKMIALGMSFSDVVKAVTVTPAKILKIAHEGYGSMASGQRANITVLRECASPMKVLDAQKEELEILRLEPVAIISQGAWVPPSQWRGLGQL